jgi:biopolymer transport protein TolQ
MNRLARMRGKASVSIDTDQLPHLVRHISWIGSREGLRLEGRLSFLATTGSAAPFIGLLGTVIGIINAFQSIGRAGSASLAVVAPGIAEALIATAVGLFAAIPATIFYNHFVGIMRGITASIDLFASEYEGDLRRLAAGGAPPTTRAARG